MLLSEEYTGVILKQQVIPYLFFWCPGGDDAFRRGVEFNGVWQSSGQKGWMVSLRSPGGTDRTKGLVETDKLCPFTLKYIRILAHSEGTT